MSPSAHLPPSHCVYYLPETAWFSMQHRGSSAHKVNVDEVHISEDLFHVGDTNHAAQFPGLNSTAQLWPLPGCNHSPGTALVNSSLTTGDPFPLPPRATLALSASREPFMTTREAIDWHILALLCKGSR